MRCALAFLIFAGCSTSSSAPPGAADASAIPDMAVAPLDFATPPPPPADLAEAPVDLGPAPDLWKCQSQIKPIPCGCPGLPCCIGMVNGQSYQFCAGTNTPTPDPAQRCFEPGDPHCHACGGFTEPCCFDGNPPKTSCRPGFECHQVKCSVASDPSCFGCDRAGCGLLPGAPCCTLPPYVCTNGMQCQNGVCH